MCRVLKFSVLFLLLLRCKEQNNKLSQDTTKMTQEIDTFDIAIFEKNKIGDEYSFYLPNEDFVIQRDIGEYYDERITPKGIKTTQSRVFIKNGKLKLTGQYFDSTLRIGKFIWYKENGEIEKVEDFDKYFNFTLEDVLQYCKDNEIEDKPKTPKTHAVKVYLWRTDSSNLTENDPIVWTISYGLVPYKPKDNDHVFMSTITITLDGKTGEKIKKEYSRAKIDNGVSHLIED